MKRWMMAMAIGILLVGIGLSAVADPIGVGGTLTTSGGEVIAFPGKGVPQGGPFSAQVESLLLSPIGVGGT